MLNTRISRRAGLAVAAVSALALAGTVTPLAVAAGDPAPAKAAAKPAAAGKVVRSGSFLSATDRVAEFYGAYIDAVSGDTGHLSDQLRKAYLTPALRKSLLAWEAEEHADGVLRAQNIPVKWTVTTDGAGAGHVFTVVTLTWGFGPHPEVTRLAVQSDLATQLISDIKPA
jgi:hypothetical protein